MCKIKRKITANPELQFLFPKWSICPKQIFFGKNNKMAYLPKQQFFSENLLINLVSFIHAYLRFKNQSQISIY